MKEDLLTEEEIHKLVEQRLDDKDFEGAAKILAYYAMTKMDVDAFVEGLIEKAKEYVKLPKKKGGHWTMRGDGRWQWIQDD